MNTVILPDDLNLSSSSSIDIYLYQSDDNLSKQQVVLNRNTISFLSDGHKEVYFDNAHFAINNDRFLLLKSGHCLMTEKLSDKSNNYISLLMFFSDDALINFVNRYKYHSKSSIKQRSVSAIKYDPYILAYKKSLMDVFKLSSQVRQKILAVKFDEIMLYLFEKGFADDILSLLHTNQNGDKSFIQIIERNQLNKLTIKELAFLCHMSVSTFKRKFEKIYGISPIKWFQNQRLEYAHRLLKDTSQRPSDIFYEVGYESLSSFIQAYKSKYGVTPKQSKK